MMKILYKISKVFLTVGLFFIFSCGEDPYPSLGELIAPPGQTPVLSSIDPINGAVAGVTVLTITGSNFPTAMDGNSSVIFDGVKGEILETSATQIRVRSPIIISDSVKVRVQTFKIENLSNVLYYKLTPAAEEIYTFDQTNQGKPISVTVDAQENVYVYLEKPTIGGIFRVGIDSSKWAPKGAEPFFNSMTFGPNNIIYATRFAKGIIQTQENTTPSVFVSSANGLTEIANDADFDQFQNLWTGANSAIFRVTLAKDVKKFPVVGNVNAIKVVDNFIYAAVKVDTQQVLWRVPIISVDSIGTPELYFDFTTETNSTFKINDIAISLDGDIYLGTSATSDPIYIVHLDKSFEKLYPGVLNSSIYSLYWGNGNFLYGVIEELGTLEQTVLRINMQKSGAPYYGRQ